MILKLLISTTSIAITCLLMATSAQATTVYKTIGEYGEVKYSQFPPPSGVKAEIIVLRPNGRQMQPGNQSNTTNAMPDPQPEAQPNPPSETSEQASLQEEDKNAEACAALRENLNSLNSGARIHEDDGKGGRKYLDNREIELKRDEVEKALLQNCTG